MKLEERTFGTPCIHYSRNFHNLSEQTGENQADFSTISIHTSKKGLCFSSFNLQKAKHFFYLL